MFRLRRVVILLMCLPGFLGCQGQPALTQGLGAKIWVGRYQEIEEYLRTAECVSMYGTDPRKATRCTLPPGGPFSRMAWRSLPPGVHRGFWESYKADIAAYAHRVIAIRDGQVERDVKQQPHAHTAV